MQTPTLYGEPGANRQNVYVHVRNDDTTTILRGAPCVYAMNGTGDGFAVVQSATAGADKSTAYFAGIVAQDIPPGAVGMSLVSGVADFVRVSASTPANVALTVNPAAANFAAGAAVSAIIAITTVGPVQMPPLVNAVATATVNGIANVSTRVMVRGV